MTLLESYIPTAVTSSSSSLPFPSPHLYRPGSRPCGRSGWSCAGWPPPPPGAAGTSAGPSSASSAAGAASRLRSGDAASAGTGSAPAAGRSDTGQSGVRRRSLRRFSLGHTRVGHGPTIDQTRVQI